MPKRSMAPLTCPQAKKNAPSPMAPLPIPLSSLTGVPASNNYWAVYRGRLVRHTTMGPEGRKVTVVVEKEGEGRAVYENGCFGLLVEGGCWVDQARVVLEDWAPGGDRKGLADEAEENEDIKPKLNEEEEFVDHKDKVVLDDGDEDFKNGNINNEESEVSPCNWGELKDLSMSDVTSPLTGRVPPELHLELCEAFYLSYALGCLTVRESDSCPHSSYSAGDSCAQCQLSLLAMWQLFRQLEPDFPLRYRVYHHYRAMGWVVRSGYCMGADWGLYKLGPAQYHATYTVRVEGVDRRSGEAVEKMGVKAVTWGDMLAQTRVAVTVKKELLVARVGVWGDFRDWDTPHCLGEMSVTTSRVKRWVVGDQRWAIKPRVPVEMKESSGDKSGEAVIVLD